MTKQRQGPLIGPLQIVYQQQDGTVCSHADQNLHDRSQEDVACLLRRQFHGRSDVGEDASKLRHKTRNLRSVIRERIAEPLSAWPLPQSAFEHFYEGNERNRIIAIVAGTSKDQSTLQQNLTAELRGNAGLSYPWRPAIITTRPEPDRTFSRSRRSAFDSASRPTKVVRSSKGTSKVVAAK